MGKFYFDLVGGESWIWEQIGENGQVVRRSAGTFPFYLDCIADATRHGFSGAPNFPTSRTTAHTTAAPQEADRA
jgi:hypothetical protein